MISILLAAYNGERFIAEQIESLLMQTVQDFKLFICDDKSTDATFSIAQDYASRYNGKISVTQNEVNTGDAKYNFIRMMINHTDDYIMLCDQDDVWLPDKIEKSLGKMKEMETRFGASKPLLVHSDLTVADENLNTISHSYVKLTNAKYEKNSLRKIIVHNTVAGCAAMYNRALSNLIIAEPEYMIMHDWWLALVASAFGEIGAIYEPTILYRQHNKNAFGANQRSPSARVLHKLLRFGDISDTLNKTYMQADSLNRLYGDALPKQHKGAVAAYASMPQSKKTNRLRTLLKYGTWKNGILRKIAQIIAV